MDPRFEQLLIEYAQADSAQQRKKVEETLWHEFGEKKAIMVMDMSGFSLLTQRYGVVHYLSMVKRMQLTSQPIIEDCSGSVVKFEADNCFAMFPEVEQAVQAAIKLNLAFNELNIETDETFDIRVSIGIDYGDVLLIGGPDYFGDTVNCASKLGEDVAEPGEILITAKAFQQIPPKLGHTGKKLRPLLSGVRIDAVSLDYPWK
jgi:class 3 adenylate cyclase